MLFAIETIKLESMFQHVYFLKQSKQKYKRNEITKNFIIKLTCWNKKSIVTLTTKLTLKLLPVLILFQTCDTVSLMATPSVQPISSTPRPPYPGQFWSSMRETRLPVQDRRPDKDHRWPSELIRIRTERFLKDQKGWRVLIGPHLLKVRAALWLVSLVWRQLWFNIWESISDPAQKQIQVQCFKPENLIGLFREITSNHEQPLFTSSIIK